MNRLQILILACCAVHVQPRTLKIVKRNGGTVHFDNDEIYSNYPPKRAGQTYTSPAQSMMKPGPNNEQLSAPAPPPASMDMFPPSSSSSVSDEDNASHNRLNAKAPQSNKMSIDEVLSKPEPVDVPQSVLEKKHLNSSTQSILQRGLTKMTLDMERVIRSQVNKNDNVVFAPLSIVGALALVLLGADGSTKKELTTFMGIAAGRNLENKTDVIHKTLGAYFAGLQPAKGQPMPAQVNFANGIFFDDRYEIKKQYQQLAQEFYNSESHPLDFGNPASAQFVNKWVSNRTEGRIANLLPGPLSPQITLILANVIYFKGQWEYPFLSQYTKWDTFDFYNSKGEKELVKVEMMTNMATVEYGVSKEGQVLGLPYKGNDVFMYFILPKNPDLEEYTKHLDYAKFMDIIEDTRPVEVIYTIPKMKVTSSIELRSVLSAMNVTSMFDISKSDLSNMFADNSTKSGVAVDQVFHKVDVEINEEGTEAAASTGIIVTRISKPMVRVNRPFIFFIYHKPKNTIVFYGTIYKPEPQKPYKENEQHPN